MVSKGFRAPQAMCLQCFGKWLAFARTLLCSAALLPPASPLNFCLTHSCLPSHWLTATESSHPAQCCHIIQPPYKPKQIRPDFSWVNTLTPRLIWLLKHVMALNKQGSEKGEGYKGKKEMTKKAPASFHLIYYNMQHSLHTWVCINGGLNLQTRWHNT